MQLTASDGVVPVHHRLGVVVVHIDVTCRTILEKYFSWNFAIAFHFILHFLCILFVHLQIVNLEGVGERNLCGTECNIDVRYLDHGFWVLPILELMRVNGQSESYIKRLASFVYLDIVLDGVVNLAEDKFSRQKLIIFSTFLHQIALH